MAKEIVLVSFFCPHAHESGGLWRGWSCTGHCDVPYRKRWKWALCWVRRICVGRTAYPLPVCSSQHKVSMSWIFEGRAVFHSSRTCWESASLPANFPIWRRTSFSVAAQHLPGPHVFSWQTPEGQSYGDASHCYERSSRHSSPETSGPFEN